MMDNRETILQAEKADKRKKMVRNIIVYGFLGVWGLMVLFPFYWMVLTSFKSYASYNGEKIPKFYVTDPTFYITALLRGAVRPGIDESAIENDEFYTAADGTVLKVKAKKLTDKPNIHASDKDQVQIHVDDEKKDKALTPDSVVLY